MALPPLPAPGAGDPQAPKDVQTMTAAELVVETAQALGAAKALWPADQTAAFDRVRAVLVELGSRAMAPPVAKPPLATFQASTPSRPTRP